MAEVFFSDQKNGYDKNQVDNYIKKVTEAYDMAYKEYLAICDKYNNLAQDYKKLEDEKQNGATSDVIAKTLINSERLAKEIIENARTEETRIIDLTMKNLEYAYDSLETAMKEVKNFLTFNNSKIIKMDE